VVSWRHPIFGGVLAPSNIWIDCNNPSVEKEIFYSTTISNCLLLLLLPKPQTCYHYAIMQLLLCVLLFSPWSKYACVCHCCMPRTCNARCWPIIAPTTTTFEWSLLQSPSLFKQQYNWWFWQCASCCRSSQLTFPVVARCKT